MRPRIIATDLEIYCPTKLLENDHWQIDEGEVASRSTMPQDLLPLIHAAECAGYSLATRQSMFARAAYLATNGSIKTHTDETAGLNAACIIAAGRGFDCPELITKHGSLELKAGDAFVFNADLPHAWLSNDFCVLASIQVKRRREVINATEND